MKRKVFNFSLLVSIGLLAFGVTGLSACSGAPSNVPNIKMEASEISMNIGETKKLGLSVQKGYADYPVRWFSSNENVAYFRNNSVGYVTAVGEGSAVVTASVAGAYVDCKINVTDDGGDPNVARFVLSPSTVNLGVGEEKQLSYTLTPEGTTVEFTSDNSSVATVSETGLIKAIAAGTSIITGFASNGITKFSTVTVTEAGSGGEGGDVDIGVSDNLKYTGTLTVGAPEKQMTFMQDLLRDFNRLTNSSITFQVTQVEEGKGAAQFASAKAAPAIFPYASDQIVDFQNLGALTPLRTENVKWIAQNMLADASTAARVGSSVLGYPFTSDNGVVMFYDSSVVQASEIDTFSKLWAKADELGYEVDFKLTEGFYAAGALHTYAGGKSLYTLTPTNTGYKSSSSFNDTAGLQAIKMAHNLLKNNNQTLRFGDGAPSSSGEILATIVDTSYVQSFKTIMGSKYAVAPLPYVDDAKTTRMGSYLGYKFYGVNATLDTSSKTMAHDVAKFLVSTYSQAKRYETFRNKPTMTSLQSICADEPHIAALNKQIEDKSTVLLTAAGSELWSATSTALQRVYDSAFGNSPTDDQFKAVLAELDAILSVTK